MIDHKQLVKCITQLQDMYDINIENIFKTNYENIYFKIKKQQVRVYKNNNLIKTYPLKSLKKLQTYYILNLFKL